MMIPDYLLKYANAQKCVTGDGGKQAGSASGAEPLKGYLFRRACGIAEARPDTKPEFLGDLKRCEVAAARETGQARSLRTNFVRVFSVIVLWERRRTGRLSRVDRLD